MERFIFTSESVTAGHPDKICDAISDSILDEALRQDPDAKMAVETTIKDELIFIYGECNTIAKIDYEKIAKNYLKELGYTEEYKVLVKVGKQSSEINHAVVKEEEIGAGDQGIMFGYACTDTKEYMPAAIQYANLLAKRLEEVQKETDYLRPDGKTQVSVEYVDNKVERIDTIVISTQHTKDASYEEIYSLLMKEVIEKVIPLDLLDENTKYLINPSGSFIVGGSFGDSGTTGRKIICDTYGGMGKIGGGCFSSKDPSKVDRSAAYYCRYVAKNLVANNLADKCEIQVSYAIGKEDPVSIYIDTFDTEKVKKEKLYRIVAQNFNFKVKNMIEELDLKKPIYKKTSAYGHFGREEFPWEKVKKLNTERIAVLTDTGSYITPNDGEKMGIYVLPLQIIENKEEAILVYSDLVDIDTIGVYERMYENANLKTSLPSYSLIQSTLQSIKEEGYDSIIAIPLTSGISSTASNIYAVASELDIPISIIDTYTTCQIQNHVVKEVKEMVDLNYSREEIVELVNNQIKNSNSFILAKDIMHLKKGGRITPAAAAFANMMKIYPLLTMNYQTEGKIDVFDKVRTEKKAKQTLIKEAIKDIHGDYTVYVIHGDDEESAEILKEDLIIEGIPKEKIQIADFSSVISIHVGMKCLAIQIIENLKI